MQGMEWGDDGKGMTEYRRCFTFEEDKMKKCIGASGRKLRQTCIWCPKYQKHLKRKEEQKHEEDQ